MCKVSFPDEILLAVSILSAGKNISFNRGSCSTFFSFTVTLTGLLP